MMKDTQKRTWAEISLKNIEHNVREICNRLPSGCSYLGVVKANAYGHGAIEVAKCLEESCCGYLAVACLDEAVELRDAGIHVPILILGYTAPEYARELARYNITQSVSSYSMAKAISDCLDENECVKVHMKLETGMGRTGFHVGLETDMRDALNALHLPKLNYEGVFTHFSVSDEVAQDAYTKLQFQRFKESYLSLEAECGRRFALHHCANSGAVINYPEFSLDMVRPGLLTYGLYPAQETGGLALRPVMELKTRVAQITTHSPGDSISYGRAYTAEKQRRLAVLSIGYADGLRRGLSGRMDVLIRGHRVKQIGRICMDMCMVDVSDYPDIQVGDVATIFGRDADEFISVDELAEKTDTISYELVCAVSSRVSRVYVE